MQSFTQLVHEEHSASSFLITLLFPEADILSAWADVRRHVGKLEKLFSELLTGYAVVGVEMHRSMHKRRKSKPSLRGRGRPSKERVSEPEVVVKR